VGGERRGGRGVGDECSGNVLHSCMKMEKGDLLKYSSNGGRRDKGK
jgi:hypothetical protein